MISCFGFFSFFHLKNPNVFVSGFLLPNATALVHTDICENVPEESTWLLYLEFIEKSYRGDLCFVLMFCNLHLPAMSHSLPKDP